ncbi:MAG: Flp pilus assembly protein CpaB [Janthinobacterium lividum]
MQIAPLRTQFQRRKTQWGTLLPALAAGLAAAGLAFLLVRSRLPADAAVPRLVSVVAAGRDIPARTKLTAALFQMRSITLRDVPEGASRTRSDFVGKVSLQAIGAGDVVTQSVVAPSASLGMAFALPPSLRAVTVATDPADGVDLFVRPEDHVDILATDEPGSGPAEARTVLQNVLLLAVGSQTSPDPPSAASSAPASGAAHVTVAVTPSQAQALVLAAARGHLHLALRAIDDGSEPALPTLPAPVAAAPHHVRVRTRPPLAHVPPTKIDPLPPMPLSLVPIALPPAHVTVTVIKGSFSQTVSVAP